MRTANLSPSPRQLRVNVHIAFGAKAARHFDGDVIVAADLCRVPVPRRR
jgi:hypothetical protein